jgi:hypothetical protein
MAPKHNVATLRTGVRPLLISFGVLGALLLAAAVAGCRKTPATGKPCSVRDYPVGTGICKDKTTALVCDANHRWTPLRCKGPKGCYKKSKGAAHRICDFSRATAGDACPASYWNKGQCGPDGKSAVICGPVQAPLPIAGFKPTFEVLPCGGLEGCKEVGNGSLTCDQSQATAGSRCSTMITGRVYTCRRDHKAMLGCAGKITERQVWKLARTCRGPQGCKISDNKNAQCDSTIAKVGDACQRGQRSCSLDGKVQLVCKAGKFVMERACAKSCTTKWKSGGTSFDVLCES